MKAYEIFRDELRRPPSRVLYSSPHFVLYENDEIYVSIVDGESARIRVVRHEPPAPPSWRKRFKYIAESFSLSQFVAPPAAKLFFYLRGTQICEANHKDNY